MFCMTDVTRILNPVELGDPRTLGSALPNLPGGNGASQVAILCRLHVLGYSKNFARIHKDARKEKDTKL